MKLNFPILLLSALIPLIVGFIWYHGKVFGKAWQKHAAISDETMKGANMMLIFGLTFLFSFFLATSIQFIVIHQYHIYSIFANDPGMNDPTSETGKFIANFMQQHGQNFRTFKHGAFHGFLSGIFLSFPILAINALFERKKFAYIWINSGFWAVCMMLMGGIICAFA